MYKQALICIAAGEAQISVIKSAKKQGLQVIAIDKNASAPGFKYADECIMLSTYHAEPIINELEKYAHAYDYVGVITRSSGIPVITQAVIANHYYLPGIDPQVAENIVFKDRLMKECERFKIPAPKYQILNSIADINWDLIEYPSIVKPSLSIIGKKGVYKINSKAELAKRFCSSIEASYNNKIIIQSYEEGCDVTLMGFAVDGRLHPIILLDEINHFDSTGKIEQLGIIVPSLKDGKKEIIYEYAQGIIDKFNIQSCIFNMSCKVTPDNTIKMIEIHLDLGGDRILDDLLPNSINIDYIDLAIRIMSGKPVNVQKITCIPTIMITNNKRKRIPSEYMIPTYYSENVIYSQN